MTSSDLKRAKVPPIAIPTGVWSMVIKKDGSFDAYRRAATASAFTGRLTATKVSDKCGERVAVFTGVWNQK